MALKIYRLTHTLQAPQIAAVPNPERFCSEVLGNLQGLERDAPIPRFQMLNSDLKSQGFFNISDKVLVFTREVYLGSMGSPLDFAGNVHPTKFTDTGEEVFLLNVTACYDCVDRSQTVFYAPNGQEETGVDHGMGIKSLAFFPKLIGDSRIFRIPQIRDAIFVASDGRGDDDDFYTLYIESGMNELEFIQVWAEEDGTTDNRWSSSESPILSGIQIVSGDFTVTTRGDNLDYVQASSRAEPNPNPKFATYGIVPAELAVAVRDMLVRKAFETEKFPTVLIVSAKINDGHAKDAMIIGKRLHPKVARALLADAASFGIKRVFLSAVHHEFIIAPKKAMTHWYPEITGSIEQHLSAFAE
jgi:hypothetical protein